MNLYDIYENLLSKFLNFSISPSLILLLGVILVLLILSAFFSGSETALTGASRAKLMGMKEKGSKAALRALKLRENNEKLIGALLLGSNIVNITATSLAASILTVMYGDKGVIISTVIMTLLILIFCEVLPKTFAMTNPEKSAMKVSLVVSTLVKIFEPAVAAIRTLVRLLLWPFGLSIDPKQQVLAHEEIAGAIALHHSEGAVKKDHKDRLLGALELNSRTVEEIMLHRSQIEMLDASLSSKEILSKCLKSPYTRLPIFKDNPENVIGVVHAKDLLRAIDPLVESSQKNERNFQKFNILKIAMSPYFIPENTTLDAQMQQFLKRKSHFALVVDEYGDLQGLLTLEDILEEIVGEISDEHDIAHSPIVKNNDGSILVDGDMTIRDINRDLEWNLSDQEANTIAGLVIHEAQAIPNQGQLFKFHGFIYEIIKREGNKVTRIRVSPERE